METKKIKISYDATAEDALDIHYLIINYKNVNQY